MPTQRQQNKGFGFVRATVVENVDPESRGRVRIRDQQDLNTPPEKLPWAEYCSPFGGGDNVDGAGFFFVPEIGSQVWVSYEGGDVTAPIYFGSSFYNRQGRQNAPIEVTFTTIEPTLRVIKSSVGHRLLMDDRETDEVGNPPLGVILETGRGTGLILQEPEGGGRGIRLGFGENYGELKLTRSGAKLQSNKKAGLVIYDDQNVVQLRDSSARTFFQFMEGKIVSRAENGLLIEAPSMAFDDTTSRKRTRPAKGYYFRSGGGGFQVHTGGNQKFVSNTDFIVQTGSNFTVQSNQFNLTGQAGSNFLLDFKIPGVPGLNQGNITLNTAGGGILLRNGTGIPNSPLPIQSSTTFTNNDLTFGSPTFNGRIGVGSQANGNGVFEGRFGGIFISGTPLTLPGTAGGLGGRPPAPAAPISPTGSAGAPQPIVLGGNLYAMLNQLFAAWNAMLTQFTANAQVISTGAMGPNALNPAVVAAINTFNTQLNTLQQTYFSSGSGVPTNILSSYVFADG